MQVALACPNRTYAKAVGSGYRGQEHLLIDSRELGK